MIDGLKKFVRVWFTLLKISVLIPYKILAILVRGKPDPYRLIQDTIEYYTKGSLGGKT